jgi:hypothetical protein
MAELEKRVAFEQLNEKTFDSLRKDTREDIRTGKVTGNIKSFGSNSYMYQSD